MSVFPDSVESNREVEFVAAADLGSNSFHLVIARLENGRLVVIDKIKEIVRLGAGLDNQSNLTPEVQSRALDCLRLFGQRLREIPPSNIRAVGTNTFRKAHNLHEFLPSAEAELGHPIEVISGREEARLIYESVCYGSSEIAATPLVADIGGGSTEVIVGTGNSPRYVESLFIGCVSMTRKYFPDGEITASRMTRAEQEALLEVRAIYRNFHQHGWSVAYGCSGTIQAIGNALLFLGLSGGDIEAETLKMIRSEVINCKHTSDLVHIGFEPVRSEVLPGGLAILCALFERLEIASMRLSDMALREGVMYDLLGRLRNNDARQHTVRALVHNWSIDIEHAKRVRSTALSLYEQVATTWFAKAPECSKLLAGAAMLHEIGISITYSKHHQHGAYLLEYTDMAGFSRSEQNALASLVRCHRRAIPSDFGFNFHLPEKESQRLCILLRLAVLFHRPRTDRVDLFVDCEVKRKKIELRISSDWLEKHPLTHADLDQEKQFLKEVGYRLRVISS